jgi:hypothetical protein
MTRFHFMVFSNPVEGRDDDFNTWYDKEHLEDLLAIDCFTAAQRYRLAALGPGQEQPTYRYAAVYEAEGDDAAVAQQKLMDALTSGRARASDAIAPGTFAAWFEPIGERRLAPS